jgi:hypothetical protein
VRDLTRLELVTEAVRAALEETARTASHLLTGLVDEGGRRYGRQIRLGKNPTRPKTRILAADDDACRLLERLHRPGCRPARRPRRCGRSSCGTTTATRRADCAGAPPMTAACALLLRDRLPLRHYGALRPSRPHHQMEGVRRARH